MRKVFADTHYWIAVTKPRDPYSAKAAGARSALGNVILVTTDDVLGEFLAGLGKGGETIRAMAAQAVRQILKDPNVEVEAQSRSLFEKGLELYASRLDKSYSLVDCVSMTVMRAHGITEVLTHDEHFEQEGFVRLIR